MDAKVATLLGTAIFTIIGVLIARGLASLFASSNGRRSGSAQTIAATLFLSWAFIVAPSHNGIGIMPLPSILMIALLAQSNLDDTSILAVGLFLFQMFLIGYTYSRKHI